MNTTVWRQAKEGMVLLELLVALAVATLISILGLRAVNAGIERMVRDSAHQLETASIGQIGEQIRGAWDARCSHSLESEPWLLIEGEDGPAGCSLRRLWIKTIQLGGGIEEWQLEPGKGGWRIRRSPYGNADAPVSIQPLAYRGEIIIQSGKRVYRAGQNPQLVRFLFPEAGQIDLRRGFAIVALW